ncbi:MAG: carboxypeptidase regulatory-like domain-containing protein [Acidobacteria bacterium]|nr:carboxypeptidase regulatory-like domain-containing protein [Acidobacteriota bacterium]MBI3656116.1 carboxypeptidase regulatory-like domain-containing protein [Acidobacteriota bacterium]
MSNKKFVFVVFATVSIALSLAGCGKKTGEEATVDTKSSSPAGGGASAYNESMGTATVTGKVAFTGPAPEKTKIQMSSEPSCLSQHKGPLYAQEGEINANGTLPFVFVYVKEGAEKWTFPTPSNPVTIDQKGCRYEPHVFGIQPNQKLVILNSDPILHNIHTYAKENAPFNLGMPTQGMKFERDFKKAEMPPISIKCDVHKWMVSYAGVVPHPFYSVTGVDGAFTLKGLPPGEYSIEAWHEKYPSQIQKVTVGDKETKELTFTFQG